MAGNFPHARDLSKNSCYRYAERIFGTSLYEGLLSIVRLNDDSTRRLISEYRMLAYAGEGDPFAIEKTPVRNNFLTAIVTASFMVPKTA